MAGGMLKATLKMSQSHVAAVGLDHKTLLKKYLSSLKTLSLQLANKVTQTSIPWRWLELETLHVVKN